MNGHHSGLPVQPRPQRLRVVIHRLSDMGGQERSTLEVLRRLVRHGWQVDLLTFENDADLMVGTSTWRRIRGRRLPTQLLRNLWFGAVTALICWLQDRRCGRTLTMTIGTAAFRADIRVVQFVHRAYHRALRHAPEALPNARTAAHRCYQRVNLAVNCLVERAFLGRAAVVIGISQGVAEDTLAAAPTLPRAKVRLVHHAMSLDLAAAREQASRRRAEAGRVPEILFVGALERKGIARVLRVLQALAASPWQFTAVGGGDLARWRAEAARLGLEGRVRFVGEQPSRPYFAAADLFFFPSVYEPFGLVVSEAVAYGLIPVCSRECGAMDLWPERPSWLDLSAQSDDAPWVQALARLLAAPALRDAIAREAAEAMSRWTWDRAAGAYHEILTTALAGVGA